MTDEILPFGLNIFAGGAAEYSDYYPEKAEEGPRIVLYVYLANQKMPTPFIIDTGSPWCVLDPAEFEKMADQADSIYDTSLNIRGESYDGRLYRLFICLPAVIGESLEVDATVFVPELPAGDGWFHPNFIGLKGFLNRIRFAVDPESNLFFFGSSGE